MKGGPKKAFSDKYNLDSPSNLANWFNALLSLTPQDNLELLAEINVKGDGKTKFFVSTWTTYANMKAKLSDAEEYGHPFPGRWSDLDNDDV